MCLFEQHISIVEHPSRFFHTVDVLTISSTALALHARAKLYRPLIHAVLHITETGEVVCANIADNLEGNTFLLSNLNIYRDGESSRSTYCA
jgi:hypothetical protein